MRTYGGPESEGCYSHIRTIDGGYALAGFSQSFGNALTSFWLLKTDSDGDSLWSRTYGENEVSSCTEIFQMDDGGYMLIGDSHRIPDHMGSDRDFLIIRTDENGDSLWAKRYGGEDRERCYAAVRLEDGFAIAGITGSWGNGGYDMWLLRLDENGDSLWSRTYGGQGNDNCRALTVLDDGGFVLAGDIGFAILEDQYAAVFTDEHGDSLGVFFAGTRYSDRVYTVIQLPGSGEVLIGGRTNRKFPLRKSSILM